MNDEEDEMNDEERQEREEAKQEYFELLFEDELRIGI